MLRQIATCFSFTATLLFFSLQSTLVGVTETAASDNPYKAAFDVWSSFSEEDRQRMRPIHDDIPVPDITKTPAFQTIATSLRAGAQQTVVNWGIKQEEDPTRIIFPHTGPARQLAFLGLSQASHLATTDPLAAVNLVSDMVALGHHVGDPNAIIPRLHQTSIVQPIFLWIGEHLPTLPPSAVSELQQRLASLPVGGNWAASFEQEKAFPAYCLDKVLDVASLSPSTDDEHTAKSLRMAGLLNDGQAVSISLETSDGGFWIQTGRTRNGVRLLSVDLKRQQALLIYEGRLVNLQLTERKFIDLDAISISATLRNLPKNHPLRNFFDIRDDPSESPSELDTVGEWISVTQEMMDYYDTIARAFSTFDFAAAKASYEQLSEHARAFSLNALPLLRTAAREEIQRVALNAALAAATSVKEGEAIAPPTDAIIDPVTQKPFHIIPTPQGYILESEFNHPPGHPVRLVIGPDPESR